MYMYVYVCICMIMYDYLCKCSIYTWEPGMIIPVDQYVCCETNRQWLLQTRQQRTGSFKRIRRVCCFSWGPSPTGGRSSELWTWKHIFICIIRVMMWYIYLTTRWFGYSPDTDRMSFSFGGIGTKLLLEATKIRTWRYQHVIQFEIILANVGFPMISKEWQYVGWLSKLTHKRSVAWNPTDRPRSSKWRSSWETVL